MSHDLINYYYYYLRLSEIGIHLKLEKKKKRKSRGIEILKIIRNFRKEYALNDVPD